MTEPLFRLQDNNQSTTLHRDGDDVFFEEAVFGHAKSAQQPTRSFVGTVISKSRIQLSLIICLIVIGILLARTAQLQIFSGDEFRLLAENNRIRTRIIPSQRGLIYDRNKIILSDNVSSFSLITTPSRLPEDQISLQEFYKKISELSGQEIDVLNNIVQDATINNETILLADDIPYEAGIIIAANQKYYQSIDLEVASIRRYITNKIPTLSHILGFTGIISPDEYANRPDKSYRRFDVIGKQGIEKYFEKELRGTFGEETVEVDALGNAERIITKTDPVAGENITLTIDSELQSYIESSIRTHLEKFGSTKASVIVMDPNTGEILALISYPAFDSNIFVDGIDSASYSDLLNNPDQPLFPRATSGEFPSGSVIKPVYATAALMEGIITPTTSFLSVGGFSVGPYYFKDWKAGGHGATNVYHAIADSVNTFFYIIGGGNETFDGLGLDRLMSYAAKFGFGSKTGIDLPTEADGFLPSKQWKQDTYNEQWYIGDTYNVSIGQGNLIVTPLQIARSIAVFANGGYLVRPKLVATDESAQQIVPIETVQIIRDAMRQTVTNGTAKSLLDLPVEVAGKTGTAQWSSTKTPHTWFVGFAPYDKPTLSVTVLVEEGSDDYLSVPIAKDIFDWWFRKYPVDTVQ